MLIACLAFDQLRALLQYSRLATDEDQTLLWFAGRELLHLHLHELNFYGQNYNTVFEAAPGALLHAVGVSFGLAVPAGTTLIATACWTILAWAAYRRGDLVAALAALAVPVCLRVPYLLLFDAPRGVLSGDLLAAAAIAAAILVASDRRRLALVIGIGGLACAWDNAAILAVAPALVATCVSSGRALRADPRRTLTVALGAAALPASWLAADHVWHAMHRAAITAPGVNTQLSLSTLAFNLTHPGALFAFYEPQLWQRPIAPILAIALVCATAMAASRRARTWAPAAAAISLLVVLLLVLSVSDTRDAHPDLYLSGSRFLLPLPLGLWSVLHSALAGIRRRPHTPRPASGPRHRPHRSDARIGVVAVVLVAAASFLGAQAGYTGEVAAASSRDAGRHPLISVLAPAGVLLQCRSLAAVYARTGAQLLVTDERNIAYGCAAQAGIDTLDQDYERRAWLLAAASDHTATRLLIQDHPCASLRAAAGTCRAERDASVLLVTPPRPPSASLRLAGIPLRQPAPG